MEAASEELFCFVQIMEAASKELFCPLAIRIFRGAVKGNVHFWGQTVEKMKMAYFFTDFGAYKATTSSW